MENSSFYLYWLTCSSKTANGLPAALSSAAGELPNSDSFWNLLVPTSERFRLANFILEWTMETTLQSWPLSADRSQRLRHQCSQCSLNDVLQKLSMPVVNNRNEACLKIGNGESDHWVHLILWESCSELKFKFFCLGLLICPQSHLRKCFLLIFLGVPQVEFCFKRRDLSFPQIAELPLWVALLRFRPLSLSFGVKSVNLNQQ